MVAGHTFKMAKICGKLNNTYTREEEEEEEEDDAARWCDQITASQTSNGEKHDGNMAFMLASCINKNEWRDTHQPRELTVPLVTEQMSFLL